LRLPRRQNRHREHHRIPHYSDGARPSSFAGIDPDSKPSRVFIEIAPGTYHERIIVTQNHTNITLLGMGHSPEDVVITNSLNAKQAGGTFFTETVEIKGAGFEADNLTFENAAGNTGQSVAVADRADRSIFKHCRFLCPGATVECRAAQTFFLGRP
jgi:pectinesterase